MRGCAEWQCLLNFEIIFSCQRINISRFKKINTTIYNSFVLNSKTAYYLKRLWSYKLCAFFNQSIMTYNKSSSNVEEFEVSIV